MATVSFSDSPTVSKDIATPQAATSVSWEVAGGKIVGPAPFIVAGIVNVTPDSFYDGGRNFAPDLEPDAALRSIEAMIGHGALIADIGGESTRPGAAPVAVEEEMRRVLPVVQQAAGLPIARSIDTRNALVAAGCLEAGAEIINDVSACSHDPELLDVLAQYRPGYVLMHAQGVPQNMQQAPQYTDVVSEVMAFFEEKLRLLTGAGVPEERIVLDPGIGFGKILEHNLELMRSIEQIYSFGRPVMLGISNKSLWGALLDAPLESRGNATQAATVYMASRGVGIHRVHDTASTVQSLRVLQALR